MRSGGFGRRDMIKIGVGGIMAVSPLGIALYYADSNMPDIGDEDKDLDESTMRELAEDGVKEDEARYDPDYDLNDNGVIDEYDLEIYCDEISQCELEDVGRLLE